MQTEKRWSYPGKGIATVALMVSTVSMTARQSDSVPIASDVAMALVIRKDATGAGRLAKPTGPGDRIMVQILQDADESPRDLSQFRYRGWQHCGGRLTESGRIGAKVNAMPAVVNV